MPANDLLPVEANSWRWDTKEPFGNARMVFLSVYSLTTSLGAFLQNQTSQDEFCRRLPAVTYIKYESDSSNLPGTFAKLKGT